MKMLKHLYNLATAGSTEQRQLLQLKKSFEKVYRENKVESNGNDIKYAIEENGKGKFVKADRKVIKGNNL